MPPIYTGRAVPRSSAGSRGGGRKCSGEALERVTGGETVAEEISDRGGRSCGVTSVHVCDDGSRIAVRGTSAGGGGVGGGVVGWGQSLSMRRVGVGVRQKHNSHLAAVFFPKPWYYVVRGGLVSAKPAMCSGAHYLYLLNLLVR